MSPGKFGYSSGGGGSTDVLFRMRGDAKQLIGVISGVTGAFTALDASTAVMANKMNRSFDIMSIAIAGVGAVSLGLMANAAKSAARIEELDTVLKLVAGRLGYTEHEIDGMVKELIQYGISIEVAHQSLLAFTYAHMKLTDAVKLARVAQDLAVISGQDSSETFKHLTLAVAKANTRMLMTFGILTTNIQAWKSYAQEVGKSVSELTIQEKRQAVLNAIFAESATMAGAYEEAMTTSAKQLRTFNRYIQDLRVELGQALLPVFNTVVYTGTEVFKTWRNLSDGTKGLIGNVVVLGSTFMLVTGSVMKLKGLVDTLANSVVAYYNAMEGKDAVARNAMLSMTSWGTAAGALALAVSAVVFVVMQYQKVVREANAEAEEHAEKSRHLQVELKRLEQQYKSGTLTEKEYVRQEKKLQRQMEENIYTFADYIDKLGTLKRMQEMIDHGLTMLTTDYDGNKNTIIDTITIYEELTGEIVDLTALYSILIKVIGKKNLEELKAIQANKWREASELAIRDAFRARIEEERLLQKQIEKHQKTIQPMQMMYEDYLSIQLDVAKKKEDLSQTTQDLIELREKEDELINGSTKTIISAQAAQDKYTKALEREATTHATLIDYQNKEAKSAVQRQQINDRLSAAQSKYNSAVEKRIELEGQLSGVYKATYGTAEEIAEVQAEIAVKVLEEKHGREELIRLQEQQRTAAWMLNNELLQNIEATDRFSEGIVTLPEVIEFWIENNIWESKEELELFQKIAADLAYVEGKFFMDTGGAIVDIEELQKRYDLLIALFGKEMAVKLTTAWAQEEIKTLRDKASGLKSDIETINAMMIKQPKGRVFWKKEIEDLKNELINVESDIEELSAFPFNLDTSEAEGKIEKLETSINELPDTHTVKVDIDDSRFNTTLNAILGKLRGISSRTITVQVKSSGISSIESKLRALDEKYHNFQHGGIITSPTFGLIGEKGTEAIIPLTQKSIHPVISQMQETLGLFGNWKDGIASGKARQNYYTHSSPIVVQNLSVREEADIYKIAKQLESLRKNEFRAQGMKKYE